MTGRAHIITISHHTDGIISIIIISIIIIIIIITIIIIAL